MPRLALEVLNFVQLWNQAFILVHERNLLVQVHGIITEHVEYINVIN